MIVGWRVEDVERVALFTALFKETVAKDRTASAGREKGVVACGFGLAVALDHGDAREAGPGMALGQPRDVAGGPVSADFEAAVVLICGFVEEGRAVGECAVAVFIEESHDIIVQAQLVVLDGQKVIGALVANCFGDGLLTAHGIDGDQHPCQVQHVQEARYGHDFVLVAVDRLLAEHDALFGRSGGDKMQDGAALGRLAGAPRGLADDSNDFGSRLMVGAGIDGVRRLSAKAMKASRKASASRALNRSDRAS